MQIFWFCYSGSMLHAMFSGRFDSKPAEDGSYFIDRDGTHFRYILNYLRTGQLVVPEDKIVRRELLTEAEFYQVQGIIDELKACPFEDSSILSAEQRQTLTKWLERTLKDSSHTYSLIYRASRNGWAASNFHSCCDRKGPTVTVVRSSNNYIFGGYTEQHWESKFVFPRPFPSLESFRLALKIMPDCASFYSFNQQISKKETLVTRGWLWFAGSY